MATRSAPRHIFGALALSAAALCAVLAPTARALDARATSLGVAPADASLQIVLPLKVDATGLEALAQAVSDPRSPRYGRYASVDALARRFGASAGTRAAVVRFLRAQGASAVGVDATGLFAEATVTVRLARRLFETPLARFGAADGSRFVAPAVRPTLPAPLRRLADGVIGLDTRPLRSPAGFARRLRASSGGTTRGGRARRARAAAQPPSATGHTGTSAGCAQGVAAGEDRGDPTTAGFTPNQYLGAYGFLPLQNAGVTGDGERLALVEIDGFSRADIVAFAQCFGLRVPPITTFGVGSVTRPLAPGGEATLDLEVADAAAPGLSGIDVYETKPSAAALIKALVAPLQVKNHRPQVVSASLGVCERDFMAASGISGVAAAERLLALATSSGVSYLAATGDQGSADCIGPIGLPRSELGVNYPSSSPWVTGVGGTNLVLNPLNQIVGQYVWNDTTSQLAATGGGLSELFFRPYYQQGVVGSDARGVPDVSMLADLSPGYAIYCTARPDCLNTSNHSPWLSVGGTSAATPLLAGGVALIDEQLHRGGRADVGFANPLLYLIGRSRAHASVFFDVTAIGNDVGPYLPGGDGRPLGCCTARRGYDLASGLGSVDIAQFARHASSLLPYIVGALTMTLPAHQRPAAQGQILATVLCARPCYMAAFAKVQIGHQSFVVDSRIVNQSQGGRLTLSLPFSTAQRSAIDSALHHHRPVLATVYGVIVDPQGVIQRQTAGRRLKITG